MKNKENKIISKGINYATFELKENIKKAVQESGLPITNIKYVLSELTNEILLLESKQIEKEEDEYKKCLKENENKKEK